jgi:rhodanese-related sulfurtransferase
MRSSFVRRVARWTTAVVAVILAALGGVLGYDELRVLRHARAAPQLTVETAADVSRRLPPDLPDQLSVATVQRILGRPDVLVLDVRSPEEFARGHLAAAVPIPVEELEPRLAEVPADRTVVLVCRSGRRSDEARAFLRDKGFSDVHNMSGGVRAWARAGLPLQAP